MQRVRAVVIAVASGCAAAPAAPLGGKVLPAQITARGKWAGEVRVAKLRVWADDEYRAQNARWQRGFDQELAYANLVLTPTLGVRLDAEYRSWDHRAPGGTLANHLDALIASDPGDDAAWVIGLTSSLNQVSAQFEEIGLADVGGWHLIVRGYAEREERKAIERALPDGGGGERDPLLAARRLHKMTAVLLHEIGHSLGAHHDTEPDQIMTATYSHDAASIGDRNRELMLIALDERLKPPAQRDPRATARALLAVLARDGSGWDAGDRSQLVARLQAQLGGSLPAPAVRQYREAEQLLASGDPRGAAMTLAPLVRAYPMHAKLALLGCKIELARGGAQDAKAIAACDQAVTMSGDVEPAIAIATALLAAGDAATARKTLVVAENQIAGLAPDAAAVAWLKLAGQYRAMGAVTWAEDALAKAGAGASSDGIAVWAATTRARYGIPRNGARWNLTPDDEAAAATAVREAVALVNASKFDAAAKAIDAAERRWPALPGVLTARCAFDYRRNAIAAARQQCDRAIEQGGSSWSLYLRGLIEIESGRQGATRAGIARIRAAIALDPDLVQAWRSLGLALGRTRATAELEQLRRDYRARFNSRLPD